MQVGVVRFLSSVGTQIEILANPVSGTSTLLEYLPQEQITCILGNGKYRVQYKFISCTKQKDKK